MTDYLVQFDVLRYDNRDCKNGSLGKEMNYLFKLLL